METSIVIAGFGGQGVLLLGKTLARIFMLNNKNVTWFPCYGSEMRGGAVNCEIVVSNDEVTSVHKKESDILVTLNDISFNKLSGRIKDGGTIILNTSMIKDTKTDKNVKMIKAPISDMALDLGNVKTTNMIALGILSKVFPDTDFSKIKEIIKEIFPANKSHLADLNIRAFEFGRSYKTEEV